MLSYFPKPYPDELLYSIIARYHLYSGNYYIRQTIDQLFGKASFHSSTLIPNNLGYMAEQTNKFGLDLDNLLFSYTLFPFYTLFAKQHNVETVYMHLKNNTSGPYTAYLGLYGDQDKFHNLRYCPICFEEELSHYGECYWHRLHQAPGVFICDKHHVPLHESNISMVSQNAQRYIPATSCDINSPIKAVTHESMQILKMAKSMVTDVRFCLENYNRIRSSFLECGGIWADIFLALLYEQDLATKGGSLRTDLLLKASLSYWGEPWLKLLKHDWEDRKRPWVVTICRRSRVTWHPIKYILIAELLCGSMESLVERIENKTLCLNKEKASRNSQVHDVNKLESYRVRWLSAREKAASDTITSIKEIDYAAYLWLHRHDRYWLSKHSPKSLQRGGNARYANWMARDVEYAKLIDGAVISLNNLPGKPIWITETRLIRMLHLPSMNIMRKHCPHTVTNISNVIESRNTWRVRKIKWAIQDLSINVETLPEWAILKKAGIRDSEWDKYREIVQQKLASMLP